MTIVEHLQKEYENAGELHHAYVIEGRGNDIIPALLTFCHDALDTAIAGNPDFFCRTYDLFGIDESRKLRTRAAYKSVTGGRQIYVLAFEKTTHEAQNALLKLMEEPHTGVHFFLIVPSASMLLPTLRSRVSVQKSGEKRGTATHDYADLFLKSTFAKRGEIVTDIIKEKDVASARVLCDDLEVALHAHAHKTGNLKALREPLEAIGTCRGYLALRSPSVKMILEYLVVTLPKI